MADNFDLRQFLTENKLTKNTQLLEEKDQYGYDPDNEEWEDDEPYTGNYVSRRDVEEASQGSDISGYWVMYGGLNKGIKEFIKMFPSQEEAQQALEDAPTTYGQHVLRGYWGILPAQEWLASGGEIGPNQIGHPDRVPPKRLSPEELKAIRQLDFDAEMEREGVEEGIHDRNILSRPLSNPAIEPLDRSPEELGRDADSRSENILRMTYRNQINDTNISDEELRYILSGKGVKGMGGTPNAVNNILSSRSRMEEAKSYKVSKNSKEAQHLKKGDITGSGEEVVSVSAGAKTPKGKVEVTLKTKDGKTKTSTWGKYTKIGVKEKETETVKENKMTQRDKYLTRLVENALGLQVTEDDNIDYTMGRHDDPNQLPNPAPELNIPEGDEMVNEKPLPKYENIEKLMQEIDKSTDEEAHKFKMQEMKRVADMLEKKCTALEEGDDADHIDQKKLKQMKKDIMSLRKNIEKMEKVGEKKFAKKETKAELKEGFDLRNFLVENKLTTNSKMLNEYEAPTGLVDAVEEFLDNSGMDPQGQLDAVEELALWCTGKIAQLENELEGEDYEDGNYDEYDDDDRFGEMI